MLVERLADCVDFGPDGLDGRILEGGVDCSDHSASSLSGCLCDVPIYNNRFKGGNLSDGLECAGDSLPDGRSKEKTSEGTRSIIMTTDKEHEHQFGIDVESSVLPRFLVLSNAAHPRLS